MSAPEDDMMSVEESHDLLVDMVASITAHRALIEDLLHMLGAMEPEAMSELRDQSQQMARGLADGSLQSDPGFPAERYWTERHAILEAVMVRLGLPAPTSSVAGPDGSTAPRIVH